MSTKSLLVFSLLLSWSLGLAAPSVETIAFGSCLRQWKPQPVWDGIAAVAPDVFVFLGDNIYADRGYYRFMREPERIGSAYAALAAQEGFQRLKKRAIVHATWDDHDYGRNNAGAEYPWRQASEKYFLDFFERPADAPERGRPGIYSAHAFGSDENRMQLILLDTRYFRSPLKKGATTPECRKVNLAPNTDPAATLLGEAQWAWLEQRLREPARLRIIASSIQMIPQAHCFEKWVNFPHERRRLFDLIRTTKANGVILLSGDRHLAEISRLPPEVVGYPLYEVTVSGMNSARAGKGEHNSFRVTPDNYREDNFGTLRIAWAGTETVIQLDVRDVGGAVAEPHSVTVPLSRLAHP